jgi:hypothetical protein
MGHFLNRYFHRGRFEPGLLAALVGFAGEVTEGL